LIVVKKKISNKIDKLLSHFIRPFYKRGVRANHISLLQLPFTVLFFMLLIQRIYFHAFLSMSVVLILDVLDGSWARVTKDVTKRGHAYDKFMDLFGIYLFLIGSFLASPDLIFIIISLGSITAFLYISNEYFPPELYCGVRSLGALGLLFIGIFMIVFKIIKLGIDYAKGGFSRSHKTIQA
jgi:phosphatidylglycerophosphate synthase